VITSLSTSDSVKITARGRAINSAVLEVTNRSFLTDLIVEDIDVGAEGLGEAGAEPNVSTISIQLSKPNA
jgi:DNA-binding protein Alba